MSSVMSGIGANLPPERPTMKDRNPPTMEIQMSTLLFSEAWVRVIRTLALGEMGRSTGTNSAGNIDAVGA
jgi:hypothetical protein